MPIDFKFGLAWQYGKKKGSFAFFHRRFLEGVRDLSPALRIVADDILEPRLRAIFPSEGASQDITWQALAPSTVARRGSEHPILHVSGHLEESFQKGGADHHEEIGPKKLVWGSDVPYALFAQFGTRGKVNFRRSGARKVMFKTAEAKRAYEASQAGGEGGEPARPMFVYTPGLSNGISSTIMAYLAYLGRITGYRYQGAGEKFTPEIARLIGSSILRSE
jgi:hypothetical protein